MPIVRPAHRSDLGQLLALYNHYVRYSNATFDTGPVSLENRVAWFETFAEVGPHRLLVAADGDAVLGCASSSSYRNHPAFARTVEVGIYIDPECRMRGIGSELYGALFEQLRSEPVHLAVAAIALPNDASLALHRKFDFVEVGVFEEYARKGRAHISSMWMQRRI